MGIIQGIKSNPRGRPLPIFRRSRNGMLPTLFKHIDKKDKKVYNRTQRDKNKKRGDKTNERRKKECKNIGFGL